MADDGADHGVVIGGSGPGEQFATNNVPGAPPASCTDEFTARSAHQHNNDREYPLMPEQ